MLSALAEASNQAGYDECQIEYLKAALDGDISDGEANRQLARALDAQGEYDGAILCWNRVLKASPGDEEAKKGIGNAQVKQTIKTGKYEEAESSKEVRADKGEPAAGLQLTEEQKLEKQLKKNPDNVSTYVELADLHTRNDRYDEAEKVLAKCLEVSRGDVNIRERLEDVQLRRMREKVAVAEKRAAEEKSEKAKELYKKFKQELNSTELSVYNARSERYPSHLGYKYELGLRLKRSGKIPEAIKALQEARTDPQRKGAVLLELGECFHMIKQHKLALSNYEQAIDNIPERQIDEKKRAIYRAGVLALGLRELDVAEGHLTTLAGIDFTYEDVPDKLDKLRRLREEADES